MSERSSAAGARNRRPSDEALREKRDQELIELLNELRVALPGVQVLFAFLLVAPLSSGWDDVDEGQQASYLLALLGSVLGTTLLIAPSAYHRLRWRERNKERMLRVSNRLAVGGLACVAVSMTASVFLVTAVVLPGAIAAIVTAATLLCFALGWFVLPISMPYDRWDDPIDDDALRLAGSHPSPTIGRSAD